MTLTHRTSPVVPGNAAEYGAEFNCCQFCAGRDQILHRVPGERWVICDPCLEEIGRRARRDAVAEPLT